MVGGDCLWSNVPGGYDVKFCGGKIPKEIFYKSDGTGHSGNEESVYGEHVASMEKECELLPYLKGTLLGGGVCF